MFNRHYWKVFWSGNMGNTEAMPEDDVNRGNISVRCNEFRKTFAEKALDSEFPCRPFFRIFIPALVEIPQFVPR